MRNPEMQLRSGQEASIGGISIEPMWSRQQAPSEFEPGVEIINCMRIVFL